MLNSSALADPTATQPDAETVVYTWTAPGTPVYTITVTYEAHAGWAFVRKTLSMTTSTPAAPLAVGSVSPFDTLQVATAGSLASTVFPSGTLGTYGVL